MINRKYIEGRLRGLGIDPSCLSHYDEPHRFYHTLEHVIYILNHATDIGMIDNDAIFLAAVFHDIIYKVGGECENLSKMFFIDKTEHLNPELVKTVCDIIDDTKDHVGRTEISKAFQELDMAILLEPLDILIDYENKIFKEYQKHDWESYKKGRIYFIKKIIDEKLGLGSELGYLIGYIESRQPKIGIYAGSFNPFHKGHLNIIEKAEKIFDKVIIAVGKNTDKNNTTMPAIDTFRQVDYYDGLLTDYIDSLCYPVTLIRGMRNSTDFQFELNQYRFLQDLKKDIQVVSIFCDKEYEHISSSAIRTLKQFNKHEGYL